MKEIVSKIFGVEASEDEEFVKYYEDIHRDIMQEQLKAFADFIQSDTNNMNYDFKDLVDEFLKTDNKK